MNTGTAIIIAAAVLGAAYVLGNLYKTDLPSSGAYVVLTNVVTGEVKFCDAKKCIGPNVSD